MKQQKQKFNNVPVAQLVEAGGLSPPQCQFESLVAHQTIYYMNEKLNKIYHKYYWVFRTAEMITCSFIIAGVIRHW